LEQWMPREASPQWSALVTSKIEKRIRTSKTKTSHPREVEERNKKS
jgi:hypothetical protein